MINFEFIFEKGTKKWDQFLLPMDIQLYQLNICRKDMFPH